MEAWKKYMKSRQSAKGYFLGKEEETEGMCKWFKWSWAPKLFFSNGKAYGKKKDMI